MSALLRSRTVVLPKTNRLLLYAARLYPNQPARAAIATISPFGFEVGSPFFFGDWTIVTSAATSKRKWLLLLDTRNGDVATAWVDRSSAIHIAKLYRGSALDFPYFQFGVDGRGCLALLSTAGGKTLLGFAQVLDDGTLVEWWHASRSDIPLADGPIVGLRGAHAWFRNDPNLGNGSTVFVLDVKRGQLLSTRRWGARIEWMVADGDLLFIFFNDRMRTTELCILDGAYQIHTLKRTEFDFETYTDGFDRIASTPGAHLLYQAHTYEAFGQIRVLNRDGFKLTTKLSKMDWRWHYYVPC